MDFQTSSGLPNEQRFVEVGIEVASVIMTVNMMMTRCVLESRRHEEVSSASCTWRQDVVDGRERSSRE